MKIISYKYCLINNNYEHNNIGDINEKNESLARW